MFTLDDFPDRTKAEDGLIAHLQQRKPGEFVASGALPAENAHADLHIRASLIRALALQQVQDVPLPERGLRVVGAVIHGDGPKGGETLGLDLEGADLPRDLVLLWCHIPDTIVLRSATIRNLNLHGSTMSGSLEAVGLKATGSVLLRQIFAANEVLLADAKLGGNLAFIGATLSAAGRALAADRIEVKGSVSLRDVTATGEVRMPGAKLGGDLSCTGATLSAAGRALSADGLEANGSVFLCRASAAGQVRLLAARITGHLDCTGAKLSAAGRALSADGLEANGSVFLSDVSVAGEVRLPGAKLGGDLVCTGAKLLGAETALNCQTARIEGVWFWKSGAESAGTTDLTAAVIGSICDDPACWPPELLLNRCRYGAFTGKGVDGAQRINWLARQKPQKYGQGFWPQPYEECARALREAGHGADARMVLIEKERLQRAERRTRLARDLQGWRRKRDKAQPDSGLRSHQDRVIGAWLRLFAAQVWDGLLGAVVGYGRQPGKAAIWLAAFLLLGWLIFARAAGFGEIKPNLPQIQRQAEWTACADDPRRQVSCFEASREGRSYPRFNALIYSADTLLPIVSLEMQSYWIPDDSKPIGKWARWYLWFHIFAGWGLTLLAVAGFSGLIKTDNTG